MTNFIWMDNKNDDILDIRDIIKRHDELEENLDIGDWDTTMSQEEKRHELQKIKDLLGLLRGNGGDEQWLGE